MIYKMILLFLFVGISRAGDLTLAFSDKSPSKVGIVNVNKSLKKIGVLVRAVGIPNESHSLLYTSQKRALTALEQKRLISMFSLHRGDLLREIELAGRRPESHRGGFLSISEKGVPPYPKVYDMKSLSPEVTIYLQKKFGKLHVNSSESGVGIDEVMTIVSGGPYTWFFAFPDGVVGKLTLPRVSPDGKAWRISYPGLVPHGGFFDAVDGLVVAYAHGPKYFVMRYEDPSIVPSEVLNTNPWINFDGKAPLLLK